MKELTIAAAVENIEAATDFVNMQLDTLGCPMKTRMQIDVAIDELLSNIARYAYHPGTGSVTIRVETQEKPRAVAVTFMDHGIPYNPLTQRDPDITLAADEREIGGLGIYLVKKSMDDVRYEYENGQNILRIVKLLPV